MSRPRRLPIIAALVVGLTIVLWVSTPTRIDMLVTIGPDLRQGPDAWIEWQDKIVDSVYGIVPGTERRIVWREQGRRTEYAVVYLHGFSASRQEIAPVPERVAERLDANLFETRLGGHGLETEQLLGASAEGWLGDANSALAIGAALGDKVILISTSTGGTLSLALLRHSNMAAVDSLIMISPNLEPANPNAKYLTWPGGPLLAQLLTGGARSWTARNELQEKFWTTTVPVEASVEVMRLVNYANSNLPATIDQNLLMIISPHDEVVRPEAARQAFAAIEAPYKRLWEITEKNTMGNHVLAGDILWPENNERFVNEIVNFVLAPKLPPSSATVPE